LKFFARKIILATISMPLFTNGAHYTIKGDRSFLAHEVSLFFFISDITVITHAWKLLDIIGY
jgi:hypothetical protein